MRNVLKGRNFHNRRSATGSYEKGWEESGKQNTGNCPLTNSASKKGLNVKNFFHFMRLETHVFYVALYPKIKNMNYPGWDRKKSPTI
jgi:hypothetical protein